MARKKYTEEQRDEILRDYVRNAREIIETEGMANLSTRRLASLTGCNSAKLYFYFDNLDDLINMACVSYLEKYNIMLANDLPWIKSAKQFLIHSWKLFLHCAFEDPEIYYHIFFGKRSQPISDVIKEYYRLYPQHLEKLDESVCRLLSSGSLEERDAMVLELMAKDGDIKAEHVKYINDLSNSYFKVLLEERMAGNGGFIEESRLIDQFMGALAMLLNISEDEIKAASV